MSRIESVTNIDPQSPSTTLPAATEGLRYPARRVSCISPSSSWEAPALFFELVELVFLPTTPPFGQNVLEQFAGRLGVRVLLAPVRGERAFHRRLQHRSAVELQPVPRSLQHGDAGVEIGEEFVEGVGDAGLFRPRCDGDGNLFDFRER